MDRKRSEPVALDDLKADPKNPRRMTDRARAGLSKSMQSFGDISGIVWNARSRTLVTGHQRVADLRARGATMHHDEAGPYLVDPSTSERFNVRVVEWSQQKARAALMTANNPAIEGEFTEDAAAILEELEGMEGFDGLGLDDLEDDLLDLFPKKKPSEDATPVPEAPVVPYSKRGDLWLLGPHRILCGDSTVRADVDRLFDGHRADLVVTSPPYNCDIQYDVHEDTMAVDQYLGMVRDVVREAVLHMNAGRFIAWNIGVTPKSHHLHHGIILGEAGLTFYRQICWAKSGVAFPIWQFTVEAAKARKYHPNYTHEVVYLFSKGEPEIGGPCEVDDTYSRDVWQVHQAAATRDIPATGDYRRPTNKKHGGSKSAAHPAAFPPGIPRGFITHLTAAGEIVYDPFMGSGTTLIEAHRLNRVAYGMELSPAYVDLIVRRWQDSTGLVARTEDGRTMPDEVAAPKATKRGQRDNADDATAGDDD